MNRSDRRDGAKECKKRGHLIKQGTVYCVRCGTEIKETP